MLSTISTQHVVATLESLTTLLEYAFPGLHFGRLFTYQGVSMGPQSHAGGIDGRCQALADPSIFATILAAFLVAGIIFSYVPQHLKIIRRRSSEGLSAWWVLLGGLSSISAIGNIMVLPTSREDMACCKILNGPDCAAALLGVVQLGCQWLCFTVIVLLFVVFYPETVASSEDTSASAATLINVTPRNSKQDQLLVGLTYFLSLFLVAIVSIATVSVFPHHTQTWADILGVISGGLAAVQYVPQIWYTWRAKDLKSLSVVTLAFQAPGAFLFALSLALRVGAEGWSTWIVYIITGTLQFVLLALAALFFFRDSQDVRHSESRSNQFAESQEQPEQPSGGTGHANERTPLLVNPTAHSKVRQADTS